MYNLPELREVKIEICNNPLSIRIKSVYQKHSTKKSPDPTSFTGQIFKNNTNFIPTQKKKAKEHFLADSLRPAIILHKRYLTKIV